ncbi:MAG TPA: TSUP family transporter [Candidatus Tectomicrobia bacterium]
MPILPGALWVCFGVAVGILSGFLGVGGGVVLTPLLLYLGYSPKVATVTALAFVIPTAWASIMKGREYVDVTLAVLLAVGAVVGAYAIGQPLVQSPHLDPKLYKKLFGFLLLVVGLDMVSGFTDVLRQRQEHRVTRVDSAAAVTRSIPAP